MENIIAFFLMVARKDVAVILVYIVDGKGHIKFCDKLKNIKIEHLIQIDCIIWYKIITFTIL